ncbi:hypothetical protein [Streptomyces sp. NPDC047097]|uniref:hypothetical protein n=1 Tax=Streptomyces sp. NPDC047097 TaxID=3155260 RepID=UPI0033D29669
MGKIGEGSAVGGTVLMVAVSPAGRMRLMDAGDVLGPLAAVGTDRLAGTDGAVSVVELADPADPQAVLTRVRTAAAAPGRLTVVIAGQLHLDERQQRLHLALARSTPAALRYTALPWDWVMDALATRPPGATTMVLDLVADAAAWQRLRAGGLGTGPRLFGRVVPPPGRRRTVRPDYLMALATAWRTGPAIPLEALHEQAVAEAGGREGALVLDGSPPAHRPDRFATADRQPDPSPDHYATARRQPDPGPDGSATAGRQAPPHRAPAGPSTAPGGPPEAVLAEVLAAARAGRHTEAAALAALAEGQVLRADGVGSVRATHWLEVRAELARLAGEAGRSCELWMAAADAHLALGRPADDEQVVAAVDRAHHQWQQTDPVRALDLGGQLAALREHVPGHRPGAAAAVRARLATLESAEAGHTPGR